MIMIEADRNAVDRSESRCEKDWAIQGEQVTVEPL